MKRQLYAKNNRALSDRPYIVVRDYGQLDIAPCMFEMTGDRMYPPLGNPEVTTGFFIRGRHDCRDIDLPLNWMIV